MCFSSWSHEVSPMREESPSQRSIFKLDISASFSICMLNFRNNLSRYSVVYFGSLFIDVLILNDLVSIAHEATFSRLIKLSKLEFFLSWKTRWRRKRLKLTAILLFPLSVRIFFHLGEISNDRNRHQVFFSTLSLSTGTTSRTQQRTICRAY